MSDLRALLASPTYGPVDPTCASSLRVAIMVAARHGVAWMGDLSPDRMSYGNARNFCAETLVADPSVADGIMWVDSDILLGPESILKLLRGMKNAGADFYSGVYHQRTGAYLPVVFGHVGNDKYKQVEVYEPGVVIKAGACGFGFVWTSTKMILAMKAHPEFDPDLGSWFPTHFCGEDLGFCTRARHAGFQLLVDTGVQVGHMGATQFLTRDDSLKALAKLKDVQSLPKVEVR
jgi:hypothetical protein